MDVLNLRRLIALITSVLLLAGSSGHPAMAQSTGPPAAETDPVVTIGPRGFEVTSADRRYGVRVHGYAQVLGRFYLDDDDELGDDSFLVRRSRVNWTFRVPGGLSARLQLEVAGTISLLDTYIDWRPFDVFALRIGRFKTPFGLGMLQSPTAMDFVERSLVSGFAPNRDNGALVYGVVGDGVLDYRLGIFNGGVDGGNAASLDFTDEKELMGRLFIVPFAHSESAALSGLGVGFAVTWEADHRAVDAAGSLADLAGIGGLTRYRTAGRRTAFAYSGAFAEGTRLRLTGQLYYYVGGFHLMGEYVRNAQDVANTEDESATLAHDAWHVGAGYAFGGDAGPNGGVKPDRNFDLDAGDLGSLELKARVSQARFDADAFPDFADPASSAETVTEIAGGLSWWWSRNARWMIDVYYTQLDEAAGGGALPDEIALFLTLTVGM